MVTSVLGTNVFSVSLLVLTLLAKRDSLFLCQFSLLFLLRHSILGVIFFRYFSFFLAVGLFLPGRPDLNLLPLGWVVLFPIAFQHHD